ncbi:hypothetical protein P3J6_121615 [Pseudoalteromonas sp. 3J6]|nr:hypothetical protein P3J6_121615 [Pseudoalteromonas sp. 3J6]
MFYKTLLKSTLGCFFYMQNLLTKLQNAHALWVVISRFLSRNQLKYALLS